MSRQASQASTRRPLDGSAPLRNTRLSDIKILMYHRIVISDELARRHPYCVHVSEFRRQVEWLDRNGFIPITLEDYRMHCEGQLELPRKPIILTFDDGYLDTYEVAMPVLNEFGMKGVVFVLGDRSIRSNTWDWQLNGSFAPLLENHHILEMAEMGFEIGAHSLTHPKLTALDEQTAWHEISRARILLEIVLNKPVLSFSYPYGFVNEPVKYLVRDAGFTHACSVWSGPLLFGKDNYELRRIPVYNHTSTISLALKLTVPFQYYSWIRSKLKKLTAGGSGSRTGAPGPKVLEPIATAYMEGT